MSALQRYIFNTVTSLQLCPAPGLDAVLAHAKFAKLASQVSQPCHFPLLALSIFLLFFLFHSTLSATIPRAQALVYFHSLSSLPLAAETDDVCRALFTGAEPHVPFASFKFDVVRIFDPRRTVPLRTDR